MIALFRVINITRRQINYGQGYLGWGYLFTMDSQLNLMLWRCRARPPLVVIPFAVVPFVIIPLAVISLVVVCCSLYGA